MLTLENALRLAGTVHLGILLAGSMVPEKLNWKGELSRLSAMNRKLFWTYAIYVFGAILSIGVISFFFAAELASHTLFARVLCGLFFLFWAGRLVLAVFFFDVSAHLTRPLHRIGYYLLNSSFVVLSAIYAWAAL